MRVDKRATLVGHRLSIFGVLRQWSAGVYCFFLVLGRKMRGGAFLASRVLTRRVDFRFSVRGKTAAVREGRYYIYASSLLSRLLTAVVFVELYTNKKDRGGTGGGCTRLA